MAISEIPLSGGSGNYLPIVVANTVIGSGTIIHTAQATTDDGKFDKLYLWVTNTDTASRTLTIGWGGTTNPDHLILDAVVIPPNLVPVFVIKGFSIRNSLVVRAAASVASVLLIYGHVHRSS